MQHFNYPVSSNPYIELAGLCPPCCKTDAFVFYSDGYLAKFFEFCCVFVRSWNMIIIALICFRECSFSEGKVIVVERPRFPAFLKQAFVSMAIINIAVCMRPRHVVLQQTNNSSQNYVGCFVAFPIYSQASFFVLKFRMCMDPHPLSTEQQIWHNQIVIYLK